MANVPPDIEQQILSCWKKYNIKPEDGWAARRRAQTDGFWLAKHLLGYTAFAECHKEIFEFFVQKDPDAPNFKVFAEADNDLHDRMLMLCRGGFKSTADIVDCVQWIICFSDIRINIMTGTASLAEEFVELLKGHFTTNADGSPQIGPDGKPRLFQILFPEHCESDPKATPKWTTPARRRAVAGPTVVATSIEKNTTGTHCDILKVDDGTTATNTNTAERLKSVNRAITQARRLVEPYGYKDRIGTPYDLADNLAVTMADEERRREKGEPPLVKTLIRPAYTVLPGAEDKLPDELTDDDVILWFPERITLKGLKTEYADAQKTDPKSYYSQFLLDLRKAGVVKFQREKMIRASVPWDMIPKVQQMREGNIFQAWDIAYGESENADFTVCATALFTGGRIYILDIVRGHFNEDELPGVIAVAAFKWKPSRIAIEDSVGTRWLKKEIRREMTELGFQINIEFVSPGQGSTSKSKTNRAKPVVRLLGDGRFIFSLEIPGLADVYDELEAFPPKGNAHDDIVDAFSLLVGHFYTETEFDFAISEGDAQLSAHDDGYYRRIHGLDKPREVEVDEGPFIQVDEAIDELWEP